MFFGGGETMGLCACVREDRGSGERGERPVEKRTVAFFTLVERALENIDLTFPSEW